MPSASTISAAWLRIPLCAADGAPLPQWRPKKTALVIGAEKPQQPDQLKDRNTCVLFGDGAGAVLLRADCADDQPCGRVLSSVMGSDGNLADLLKCRGAVRPCPSRAENVASRPNTIHMEAAKHLSMR